VNNKEMQELLRYKSIYLDVGTAPSDIYTGKIDGPNRPLTLIKKRKDFFAYHQFLRDSGVECGEVGGHLDQGRVLFHFYDMDGNRFNVSHC
jgi:hypothetical protein